MSRGGWRGPFCVILGLGGGAWGAQDLGVKRTGWEGAGWAVAQAGGFLVGLFPRVKPSSTCGPFRTLDSMYEAGRVWVRYLEAAGPRVSWLPWVHRYLVENTFFVFLVSALLL